MTSAGSVLKTPLPGGGKPNPACAAFTPKDITNDPENGQSLGSVITLGQFRAIDLGDLLWNKEHDLMCPNNPIGTIDLYLVSHHGTDPSGSPQLVHALQPRVAVMQNGTRKGAGTQAMPTMRSSPGLEDIWQLHWSLRGGHRAEQRRRVHRQRRGRRDDRGRADGAAARRWRRRAADAGGARGRSARRWRRRAGDRVAADRRRPRSRRLRGCGRRWRRRQRLPPRRRPAWPGGQGGGRGAQQPPHTPAYWIKITAQPDGSFTVSNSRNGYSKTYAARPRAR